MGKRRRLPSWVGFVQLDERQRPSTKDNQNEEGPDLARKEGTQK